MGSKIWADEGASAPTGCGGKSKDGRTGSSAPTFKVDGAAGRNGEEFMQTLQMVLYFRALKC